MCLGIVALFFIYSCAEQSTFKPSSSKRLVLDANCQVVQHSLGETCVPVYPHRIVSQDEIVLDAILALGVKPVGTGEPDWVSSRSRHLSDKAIGITSLGKQGQLSLERLLSLNPDLILGVHISQDYSVFSKIAPTVSLNYVHDKWQETLEFAGIVLNKQQQVKQLLNEYQQRIKQLQEQLGDGYSKKIYCSYLRKWEFRNSYFQFISWQYIEGSRARSADSTTPKLY